MTNERFNKSELDIITIIPSNHFRTVESFHMHKVKAETKVEIELKDKFKQELNFKVPWDGKLYAYYLRTEAFLELCRDKGVDAEEIITIYLEDWDRNFSVIFETNDAKRELSFYAARQDMKYLLENCCRIPEQR
ncbi:hypothetical protein acsn021_20460 [Anaerocolumna cellulosilytica]|uniref:Uncharacterized protein n=1 Tax=Anaerocolumna cellulosilytica TaxID=433286 RepID=A0A6S6R336_9FIRM|nr:hypothetical protein [Anaerocolumna cellulosilytica]MBB5196401.1 hypothetical protein [Anaerocolumna cellulosilytica]BCJ94477.1 hypothetical protein acsn021_20460 [Anaerocolumna cellulosilytica]